jgi:hypothetical protein
VVLVGWWLLHDLTVQVEIEALSLGVGIDPEPDRQVDTIAS